MNSNHLPATNLGSGNVNANEEAPIVIPGWKIHLDARAKGRDDPRCYWEVYDTDDTGRRQRTVAAFRTFDAAARYMGRNAYYGLTQVRIFDTAEEVRVAEQWERRKAALAKLTREERELLGLEGV